MHLLPLLHVLSTTNICAQRRDRICTCTFFLVLIPYWCCLKRDSGIEYFDQWLWTYLHCVTDVTKAAANWLLKFISKKSNIANREGFPMGNQKNGLSTSLYWPFLSQSFGFSLLVDEMAAPVQPHLATVPLLCPLFSCFQLLLQTLHTLLVQSPPFIRVWVYSDNNSKITLRVPSTCPKAWLLPQILSGERVPPSSPFLFLNAFLGGDLPGVSACSCPVQSWLTCRLPE